VLSKLWRTAYAPIAIKAGGIRLSQGFDRRAGSFRTFLIKALLADGVAMASTGWRASALCLAGAACNRLLDCS